MSSRIIADTIHDGCRIITVESDVPTFALAQIGKHRAFSLSAQSARAVPIRSMIHDVPRYVPNFHGQPNRVKAKGMRDGVELPKDLQNALRWAWRNFESSAELLADHLEVAAAEAGYGISKGEVNRLLAPFRMSRIVMTGLMDDHAWGWLFSLRCGQDAQAPVSQWASEVRDLIEGSTPLESRFHIPYRDELADLPRKDAIVMSIARCATVSYRDAPTLKRARRIVKHLMSEGHWVPLEHVCFAFERVETYGGFVRHVPEMTGNHFRHRSQTPWCQVRKLYDPHCEYTDARRQGRQFLGIDLDKLGV